MATQKQLTTQQQTKKKMQNQNQSKAKAKTKKLMCGFLFGCRTPQLDTIRIVVVAYRSFIVCTVGRAFRIKANSPATFCRIRWKRSSTARLASHCSCPAFRTMRILGHGRACWTRSIRRTMLPWRILILRRRLRLRRPLPCKRRPAPTTHRPARRRPITIRAV